MITNTRLESMKTKKSIYLSVKVLVLLGICFYGVSCFTPYPPNYITIHKFKDSTYYDYVMAGSNKRFGPEGVVYKFIDKSYIVCWGAASLTYAYYAIYLQF